MSPARYVKGSSGFVELGGGTVTPPVGILLTSGQDASTGTTVYYAPFWVPVNIAVDRQAVRVAVASGTYSVGVYNSTGSGASTRPNARLAQGLSFTEITLTGGLVYWVALTSDNLTATYYRAQGFDAGVGIWVGGALIPPVTTASGGVLPATASEFTTTSTVFTNYLYHS